MRFSMAFARMRLSDRVEPRDVEMATSVAKSMIAQTFDPNSGTMNIDQLTVDTSEGSTTGTDYDSLRGELSDALDPMDWQYADEIARQVSASESKVRNALQMAQRGELSLPVEEDSGKWRLN
jgi:DNA replicative helicase MCM subunit Mcm2 (Cdc46/Mcm family)